MWIIILGALAAFFFLAALALFLMCLAMALFPFLALLAYSGALGVSGARFKRRVSRPN